MSENSSIQYRYENSFHEHSNSRIECLWLSDGKNFDCLELKLKVSYGMAHICYAERWLQKYTVGWNMCRCVGSSNASHGAHCFQKLILLQECSAMCSLQVGARKVIMHCLRIAKHELPNGASFVP